MRREPVIYDLWADIRFYWKVADYFDAKWDALRKFKEAFLQIHWDAVKAEPRITLIPYRAVLK